jgi:hypothetical protein
MEEPAGICRLAGLLVFCYVRVSQERLRFDNGIHVRYLFWRSTSEVID